MNLILWKTLQQGVLSLTRTKLKDGFTRGLIHWIGLVSHYYQILEVQYHLIAICDIAQKQWQSNAAMHILETY